MGRPARQPADVLRAVMRAAARARDANGEGPYAAAAAALAGAHLTEKEARRSLVLACCLLATQASEERLQRL